MFLQNANVPCNNAVFTLGTIRDMEDDDQDAGMHPSTQRLYAAAKAITSTEGKSNLARLLNESPQTVTNWRSRGVSESGALKAQERIGCDALWVLNGTGGMLAGWPFTPELRAVVVSQEPRVIAQLENAMRVVLNMAPVAAAPALGLVPKGDAADIGDELPESDLGRKFPRQGGGKRRTKG
jgi:hypothetical protein